MFMLAMAEWSFGYALELSSADLPNKLFWAKAQYLGIVIAPLAVLTFALQYTGREKWLTRRNLTLLAVEPLIMLLLVSTNEKHNLVWSYTRPFSSGPLLTIDFGYGAGFWIHAAYSYLLLLIGTILLASIAFRSPRLYRKQSIAVLIGVLAPWVGNIAYLLDLGPVSHLDLTPFAFTITGITLTVALFRYHLLDILPVAHDALFERVNEGVIIGDVQNRIVDLNPAAQRILRCTASEAVGRTVAQVMPIHQVSLLEGHHEVREAHEEVKFGDELAQRDYHLTLTSLQDQSGRHTGYLIVLRDITEDKLKARLDYLAHHDSLTDLPNRRLFMDRLEQALKRTRRRSGFKKVAVLYLDLDNFKLVNDSLGHKTGDKLLMAVAERLRRCLRPEDTLARLGGDEFTILIEDTEDFANPVRIAERIIEALREPFVIEGRELFVKPSIGITLGEARTTSSLENLLREADTAMYQAKKEGLGYVLFEPVMYEQALRRLKMENELQRAIESEQFVVHYQPIIDLRSDKEVWGMEALVRWQHPERGLLYPKEFIPATEESGLVVPMGERVLKEACEQVKEWQERHPHVPPLVMSVNLSARQLGHSELVRTVKGVLKETGLEGRYLSLDITETVYVKTLEANTATLNELKRMGVRISIDDFGTGYSSLAYLKRLPADALKIDKSFIRALGEDVEDTVLLQMIIDLAHTFGMEAIAEGVESQEQAAQLKEMGCDQGQGYYFAEPLSPEVVPKFLTQ